MNFSFKVLDVLFGGRRLLL
jgi:hypothetical protein